MKDQLHTEATFQALVDAMIPKTPMLAVKKGSEQLEGASDLHIHLYVILQLDHFIAVQMGLSLLRIQLSYVTAKMLDSAADQLITKGIVKELPSVTGFQGGGTFTTLLPEDRIRVLASLGKLELDLGALQPPYQNNPEFVIQMVRNLFGMVMFGYYSEWTGYGNTRLFTPDARRMDYFPPDWRQVGYPGPAFGYRDFRGFLLTFPHKQEGIDES
jgi:hypothetical protein